MCARPPRPSHSLSHTYAKLATGIANISTITLRHSFLLCATPTAICQNRGSSLCRALSHHGQGHPWPLPSVPMSAAVGRDRPHEPTHIAHTSTPNHRHCNVRQRNTRLQAPTHTEIRVGLASYTCHPLPAASAITTTACRAPVNEAIGLQNALRQHSQCGVPDMVIKRQIQ